MTTPLRTWGRPILLAAAIGAMAGALPGCTNPRYVPTGHALTDVRNQSLPEQHRIDATRGLIAEADRGEIGRGTARGALKDVAWDSGAPHDLRLAAIDALLSDTSPEGEADSRRLVALMLPRETSRAAVALMASWIERREWRDVTPALVRSYARPVPGVDEAERAERIALRALHPERSIEEVAFRVFVDPDVDPGPAEIRWDRRTRADAWQVLRRLDPEGETTSRLLREARERGGAPPIVRTLARAGDELRTLPVTGMELAWLESLLDNDDAVIARRNTAWWDESSRAIAGLDDSQRYGLSMRHVEPIRWAAAHRPEWLGLDREALLGEAASRLEGRRRHRRTADVEPHRTADWQRLRDWQDQMVWGDFLALLVVDEAVQDPGVRSLLFQHVELDRRDRTTEYGGVIEPFEAGGFRAVLFIPRARDRQGPNRFVASEDMFRYSDRALAHYHNHAQSVRNQQHAGPSRADLEAAARSGRTSLVFTTIRPGVINADYYQPDGVVIDLGELTEP